MEGAAYRANPINCVQDTSPMQHHVVAYVSDSDDDEERLDRHVKVVVDNPTSLDHVAKDPVDVQEQDDMTAIRRTSSLKNLVPKSLTKPSLLKKSRLVPVTRRIQVGGPSDDSARLHAGWNTRPSPSKSALKRSLSFFAASTRSYDPNVLRRTLDEVKDGNKKWKFVLHPLSITKTIWDFATALFVLMYCWMVPTQMCFDSWYATPMTSVMLDVLDVWFLLDMLLRFRTGVVECGTVIMKPSEITARYIRSVWFYIDLSSSFPFELFLGPGVESATSATTRHTVKLVKYLKIPKLLRLGRLLTNMRRYKGYFGIVTIMGSLFFLAHAAACIWVVLVDPCDEHTSTFEPLCDPNRFSDLYILAFQIALAAILGVSNTQLESTATVLSGAHKTGTTPTSLYVWSAVIQPLGAIYMALIFGNVITIVQSFNRIGNTFRKKMDQVHYEMEALNLPKPIRTRVLAYYDYLWVNNRNLSETMTLLNDQGMSDPLRHQIAIYLYKDQLLKIPFFQHASDEVLGMICMRLRQVVFLPNDYIFKEGEIGRELYLIVKGCVEVLPPEAPSTGPDVQNESVLLADGDFFGEIGIVMEVYRTRSVRTKTMAELCILTRDGFNGILGDFPQFAQEMTKLVVKRISLLYGSRNLPPETLTKITDIAERNLQRRIKAYSEMGAQRRPSAGVRAQHGDKFDLQRRLTTAAVEEEDDEIDDKLVAAKVWKIARQVKQMQDDTVAQNIEMRVTMAKLVDTMAAMQRQLDALQSRSSANEH